MNIFPIVHAAVSAVSPQVPVSIQISTGSTTNADGSRSLSYAAPQTVNASIQALQYNDIVQADSMQIEGVRRKMYVYGEVDGLVRSKNKGGDLVTLPNGSVWKVALIAEAWATWTCAIITLENGS